MEGVHWLFSILNYHSFFRDCHFYRYIDYLPQIPTLAAVTLFPFISKAFLVSIFCLSYALQNLFFLLVIALWLFMSGAPFLIPFLLLAFALFSGPIQPEAHLIVPTSLLFFWWGLFAALLQRPHHKGDLLVIVLIDLGLAIGHESSALGIFVLLLVSLTEAFGRPFQERLHFWVAGVVHFFVACYLIFRVMESGFDLNDPFVRAIQHDWTQVRILGLSLTLLFSIGVVTPLARVQSLCFWLTVALVTLVFVFPPPVELLSANRYRVIGFPFAIIAASAIVWRKKTSGLNSLRTLEMQTFVSSLGVLYFLMLIPYDLLITRDWATASAVVQTLTEHQSVKCAVLPMEVNLNKSLERVGRDRLALYSLFSDHSDHKLHVLFSAAVGGSPWEDLKYRLLRVGEHGDLSMTIPRDSYFRSLAHRADSRPARRIVPFNKN